MADRRTKAQLVRALDEAQAELVRLRRKPASLTDAQRSEDAELVETLWKTVEAYGEELEGIRDGIPGLLECDKCHAGALTLLTLDLPDDNSVVTLVCDACGKVASGKMGLTIELVHQSLAESLRAWAHRNAVPWPFR
jgi:hypothetical protein